MSRLYSKVFLFASTAEQLADMTPVLQARGYEVRSMHDVLGLLDYMKYAHTPRNLRWGITNTLLLCHFSVLHRECEATYALTAINHARTLGQHIIHLDELPLTPPDCAAAFDEVDLAGDVTPTTPRLREQLKKALGRVTTDLMRAENWLNKLLGDSLKNPMVREHRRACQATTTPP